MSEHNVYSQKKKKDNETESRDAHHGVTLIVLNLTKINFYKWSAVKHKKSQKFVKNQVYKKLISLNIITKLVGEEDEHTFFLTNFLWRS